MEDVSRKFTLISERGSATREPVKHLEQFRGQPAYVLLGGPGSGKTTEFRREAERTGACYVSARNFIALHRDEWGTSTIFIDGLDEMRIGTGDPRKPLDQIRRKLCQLGPRKFRISCRDGEWLGLNDRRALAALTDESDVPVLRINPLGAEQIQELLNASLDPDRSQQFLDHSIQSTLQGLLGNPLTLRLLAKACSPPGPPLTRTDGFKQACEQLATETSDEHYAATFATVDRPAVLRAAEKLCTLLLLSGKRECCRGASRTTQDCLDLGELGVIDRDLANLALRSRIFELSDTEGLFSPVHLQIAEFLAAGYLAHRISKGLPVRRILSLVCGFDGMVVAEFSGLTAWIATLCRASRSEIIERNALGVLFDGDIKQFSPTEKSKLIECVSAIPWQGNDYARVISNTDARLDDLATQNMVSGFRKYLGTPADDDVGVRATLLVTRSLRGSPAVEGLAPDLIRIVRSDQWHPRIRYYSLSAVITHSLDNDLAASDLKGLVQDIADGTIPDEDDEMLGLALRSLYPAVLGAAEIVQYLKPPKDPNLIGAYFSFWYRLPSAGLNPDEIGRFLDAVYERKDEFASELVDNKQVLDLIGKVSRSLLTRYLEADGSVLNHARLYQWIELVINLQYPYDPADWFKFQAWVISHPDDFRRIVSCGLEQCVGTRASETNSRTLCRLLNGLEAAPARLAGWLREQSWAAKNPSIVRALRQLSERAVDSTCQIDTASSQERSLENAGATILPLLNDPDADLDPAGGPPLPVMPIAREPALAGSCRDQYVPPWLQAFRGRVRADLEVVASKQCPVAILDRLARTYLDLDVSHDGQAPTDRLFELLADESLVNAALEGLRSAVYRTDVPTPEEVADLVKKDLIHPLARPFLAGLAEIERAQDRPEVLLDTDRLRTGLALHFGTPFIDTQPSRTDDTDSLDPGTPLWYQRLLTSHAEVVAEVLVKIARAEVSKGRVLFDALVRLETSSEHRQVARLACPPLLRSMPVRSNSEQIDGLACLLRSAIVHCDQDDLQGLIDSKVGRSSIHAGQRVYWLTAGLFCSPARCRQKLVAALRKRESLTRHLVDFLMGSPSVAPREPSLGRLDRDSVEALILLVGKLFEPPGIQTMWLRGPVLVEALIRQLGEDPSENATESFSSLLQSPELKPWRRLLQEGQREQAATRRTVSFRYVATAQLVRTLANAKPGNAADLAALTTHHLEAIAKRIRHGNTSDWRQYWDWPKDGPSAKPRHEDLCRDALLSDLRLELGRQIGAEPEGRYADDTRADIRVSCNGFNVPVELKKSDNRGLWTAIRDQLLWKYTRDPGCDGYGVYVVLWFGQNGVPAPHQGISPSTAEALRSALLNSLSPDEKRRLSIVVIDVAKRPS